MFALCREAGIVSDDVLEEENAESYSEEDSETEIDEDGYVVYKAKKVKLRRLFLQMVTNFPRIVFVTF